MTRLNYSITGIQDGELFGKQVTNIKSRGPSILLDQPGRGQGDVITPAGESVNSQPGAGNHKLQHEDRDY
jgi:hypothetical protein